MATKIKDLDNLNHTSRFNFARSEETGTIHELLKELNIEFQKENGEEIKFESLEGVLDFIKNVTGIAIENDKSQIPLKTLKTIKLLFIKNDESNAQLFRKLASPRFSEKPTMEFSTTSTISRDKETAEIINSLIKTLALEISPDKINLHSNILVKSEEHSIAEKIQVHIERTDIEIGNILINNCKNDSKLLADNYYYLANTIESLKLQRKEKNPITPVNEAIFVHLNTIALQHFIPHLKCHIKDIKIKHPVNPIIPEASEFMDSIQTTSSMENDPSKRIFSINNFYRIVFAYPDEISALVKKATGIDTEKRQLRRNTVRARNLLIIHGARLISELDRNTSIFSLLDIIAALCAFRYQQEYSMEYKPFWIGQVDQGKSPQKHYENGFGIKGGKFKEDINRNDLYQHQGVFMLYYYRFCEYQATFNDTKETYDAMIAYKLARLSAYEQIIQCNSIIELWFAAISFDSFCRESAYNV